MLETFRYPLSSSRIACMFISFGTFTVSDTLFHLLADVSHLGLDLSAHVSSSSDEVKSSWSLPSIVSPLRVAVVAARCSSVSFSSFVTATVVAACFCSSIYATSFAAVFFTRNLLLLPDL